MKAEGIQALKKFNIIRIGVRDMIKSIHTVAIRNSSKRRIKTRFDVTSKKENRIGNEDKYWYVLGKDKANKMIFESFNKDSEAVRRAVEVSGKILNRGKEIDYKVIGNKALYVNEEDKRVITVELM